MTISVTGQADNRSAWNAADQSATTFNAEQAGNELKRGAAQAAKEVLHKA